MEQKHKFYAGLLLSIFLTTLFVGYTIGYHEAEELYGDGWKRCNDGFEECVNLLEEYNVTLKECVEQLKEEEVNYKLKLLEKGYNNGWWSYNWSKGIIEESWSCDVSWSWICYSKNCTEEQINEFVKQNYTYYDDFRDCYIWRNE